LAEAFERERLRDGRGREKEIGGRKPEVRGPED